MSSGRLDSRSSHLREGSPSLRVSPEPSSSSLIAGHTTPRHPPPACREIDLCVVADDLQTLRVQLCLPPSTTQLYCSPSFLWSKNSGNSRCKRKTANCGDEASSRNSVRSCVSTTWSGDGAAAVPETGPPPAPCCPGSGQHPPGARPRGIRHLATGLAVSISSWAQKRLKKHR